ncbi:hypothetical protein [Streptomyces sp. NPDC008240]|uniref:hypothetical protein n=1 Tax=Streptomyces sp. NPDC008240 TaxID=3364822 RepID=UPI0036E08B2A
MAYVRGHYRRNGSYVHAHHRRTRSAAPSSLRSVGYSRNVRAAGSGSRSAPSGPTTYVRGHYRNGSYVRPHHRRISPPAAAAAGGGAGIILLIVLVLALLGGGGTHSKGTPGKTSPASSHTAHHLPR